MNIEHPNYTLVGYKSDGFSTCMGHVNETWSSDFKLFPALKMDDCLRIHAELKRTEYSEDEPEWEITILYRGVPILDSGTAIHELYFAALDQEVEDQNEKAAARAVQALEERDRAAAQLAESQREANVQKFLQTAEELGYAVTLK